MRMFDGVCEHARVLAGVRVVDLSTEIAGPYCTKLLADAGADVVKVEPAGRRPAAAPAASGALFEFLNTSKRVDRRRSRRRPTCSTCARVRRHRRRERRRRARSTSRRCAPRNPALVVVSITPFGQDGPWADRPATEFTLQAWCGSTGSRGDARAPAGRGRRPASASGSPAPTPRSRRSRRGCTAQRTGRGEHVDVALLDVDGAHDEHLHDGVRRVPRLAGDATPDPHRRGAVDRADDRRLRGFTTNSAQQFSDFLVLIGRPDLADDRRARRARSARFQPAPRDRSS